MDNPICTKEGREELRKPRDEWRTSIAPHSTITYLHGALDGLDIAQDMAEELRMAASSFSHREKGFCNHCLYAKALAKWDKWLAQEEGNCY